MHTDARWPAAVSRLTKLRLTTAVTLVVFVVAAWGSAPCGAERTAPPSDAEYVAWFESSVLTMPEPEVFIPDPQIPSIERAIQLARLGPTRTFVSSGLSATLLTRVSRRHLVALRECYEPRLTAQPELHGRLVARFEITAAGGLLNVRFVSGTTVTDTALLACVQQVIEQWRLPEQVGRPTVAAAYAINLGTVRQGRR